MLPILASEALFALCTVSSVVASTQPANETPATFSASLAAVSSTERAPADQPAAHEASAPLSATLLASIASTPASDQSGAAAEPYRNLYRRFGLSIGGALFANFDTTLQVNSESTGLGTVLNLEDLLALDDSSGAARIDGHYAFNQRHRVDFSYYDIKRNGSRQINDDIQIGGITIPASVVDTDLNTQVLKLAYRYNFVTDERTVIGASIGLHTLAMQAKFKSAQFNVAEDFKMAAPLPVLGLHAAYALDHKWTLAGDVELLQIDIGSYAGFISDTRLTLEHDTFENFGWGFGFNGFQLNGKAEGNGDRSAQIDYGYQSVMLYLRFFF
jgi:hypothetical protein